MDELPLLLLLLVLMLFNALLTAGRTALTVLSDAAIKKMTLSGDRKALFVMRLLEKPNAFLEGCKLAGFTCTVINAVLGTLLGWLWLVPFFVPLADLRISSPVLAYLVLSLVIFLPVVFLLDVFCLLLPYRIACRYPQPVAFALAGFCKCAALLFRPFTTLNGVVAGLLAQPFGARRQEEEEQVTEEEIRMMVDVGEEKGAIESSEKDMINNIFEFDDRGISEVMTHRTDMTAVPKTVTIDELAALAIETGFSRIPVYEDDIDDIAGILYVKDLLQFISGDEHAFDAIKCMRSALFVPENMHCIDLLAQFKLQKVQVAIAVDEYGGTAGIVSMEDLLESIVGNIEDEYDTEDNDISKLSDDCYSLDGTVSIEDVERLFDAELDDGSDCDTISGLLIEALERIPARDEHPAVTIGGIKFTVTLVEDRRIARLRAERA